MIIIIRALFHVRKGMMETMIPPQVGMRLLTEKEKKRGHKKRGEKAQIKKEKK